MNKIAFGVLASVAVLVVGFFVFNSYIYNEKQADPVVVTDYKNATYVIDGQVVALVDGVAETDVDGVQVTTSYFGNELVKDLNGDGVDDVVFLLTQNPGGSGTFFYVVAALASDSGYVGSQALFLGDRIAPQTTESGPGNQVIVNYATRALDEPMTTPPSVGTSLRLLLDPETMQFGEVMTDFEGEANPDIMTLDMQTWTWVETTYNDQETLTPNQADAFTVTFGTDDSVSITTDCNTMGGSYTVQGSTLTFGPMFATEMFCEDSQEQKFAADLAEVQSFSFTTKGELLLESSNRVVVFR